MPPLGHPRFKRGRALLSCGLAIITVWRVLSFCLVRLCPGRQTCRLGRHRSSRRGVGRILGNLDGTRDRDRLREVVVIIIGGLQNRTHPRRCRNGRLRLWRRSSSAPSHSCPSWTNHHPSTGPSSSPSIDLPTRPHWSPWPSAPRRNGSSRPSTRHHAWGRRHGAPAPPCSPSPPHPNPWWHHSNWDGLATVGPWWWWSERRARSSSSQDGTSRQWPSRPASGAAGRGYPRQPSRPPT